MTWPVILFALMLVAIPFSDPVGLLSFKVRDSGPIYFEGVGAAIPEVAETDADGRPLEVIDLAQIRADARSEIATRAAVTASGQGVLARPLPDSTVSVPRIPASMEAPVIADAGLVVPARPGGFPQDAHVATWLTATAPEREQALALNRRDRAAAQRRLVLMGFLPERRIDGRIDAETRVSVSLAQGAFGLPPTGYLDDAFVAELEQNSAEVWAAWEAERRARVRYAAKRPSAAPDEALAPGERGACRRDGTGRILADQSFGCDLRGVKEGLQRFFAKLEVTPDRTDRLPESGTDR